MESVLHVALQLVDDCKVMLTPFLPHSAQRVHELLGNTGRWTSSPELREVDEEGGRRYSILTGDYDTEARWESTPIRPGTPLRPPTPVFTKLDPSIVDEELARLTDRA
jgi:methionyl-tRNA synthetase